VIACSGRNAYADNYTGSTPASTEVRTFLGIPLKDSIDFIRWYISISESHFELKCNYGIGKPNTNGFINNGNTLSLEGVATIQDHFYILKNKGRVLNIAIINNNLLHLLDTKKHLLIGNGGWSYTLNNNTPLLSNDLKFYSTSSVIKDSLVLVGRTPCAVPGVLPEGKLCYKLKWKVILYASAKDTPGTCRVYGTPYRKEGSRKGYWHTRSAKNGRISYEIADDTGKPYLYLLPLDEQVFIFTDANGNLLTGNEDFSYTLNKAL